MSENIKKRIDIDINSAEFQATLEEVGALIKVANMDLDNVESETDRIVAEVDTTVVQSRRRLAGIAERVRRGAQAMIYLTQAVGFAFGQAFATAIEMVALSIEVMTSMAAAESLSIYGVVKIAYRIQLVAQLAVIQTQLIRAKEENELGTERAVAGILRVMSF